MDVMWRLQFWVMTPKQAREPLLQAMWRAVFPLSSAMHGSLPALRSLSTNWGCSVITASLPSLTPACLGVAMPVHSREKKESNHDEMEVDFPEQDGSSTDEEDTVSSSVSEDGDSSEMDDEDCERRRMECLDEMTTLEKQFTDLKEQLYKERLSQVDIKLQEVMAGCAQEYLEPLANLQENMQIRTKVAELWNDGLQSRKNKKKDPFCPVKKKKPAMASLGPHRVKVDVPAVKPDRHHHVVRFEDGRLFYDNQWYCRGQAICINRKDEYPTSAIITTMNGDEVFFKRLDGTKSKLYISQLQKGKYTIKHS
ncbi:hypothetical protein FQN60_015856 [Etheostoma spectabile]|uniref:Uncharacterized protein n=1 Tax=Etheostoma spectabile TaxID=54343 RepID=A0A5J5CSA7_9PERO|nr:hypothetical protein FQN60_015856 [Etheostoma spectabile]